MNKSTPATTTLPPVRQDGKFPGSSKGSFLKLLGTSFRGLVIEDPTIQARWGLLSLLLVLFS